MSNHQPGRIQIHGKGIGEISEADIDQRAREIAKTDGRRAAGPQDRTSALNELQHSGPPPSPEADESTGPVELWSNALASKGHRGVQSGEDDEESPAEQLVNEGLEEADTDRRIAASKESPR